MVLHLIRVPTTKTINAINTLPLKTTGCPKIGGGYKVCCNPPYGREIGKWIKKCHDEAKKPDTVVVALLPARTDTKWFHEYIYNKAEIDFLRGRLKFGNAKNSAPFPSMIVKW